MQTLSHIWSVKFSTQHKVIFDQFGVLSREDSCGDIPGHGVLLFFLGHLAEWTLKSFLVLFHSISLADHKKYQMKGYNGQGHQWAKRLNSCQVYWALFSVVAVSYKFPIREKQFISAISEHRYEELAYHGFSQKQMFYVVRSFSTSSQIVLYTVVRFPLFTNDRNFLFFLFVYSSSIIYSQHPRHFDFLPVIYLPKTEVFSFHRGMMKEVQYSFTYRSTASFLFPEVWRKKL